MGTMIRKCAVCGKIMGSITMNTFDGERTSHGYCSDECSAFVPVQLMFWDEKIGCFNMDQGQYVGGAYYYKCEPLERYICQHENVVYGINTNGEYYAEEAIEHCSNKGHALRVMKEESKKWDVKIIL
jgi:hypothetical protein